MYPAMQVADYYTAVRFGYLWGWSTKPTSNEFSLQLVVLIWIGIWLSKRLFFFVHAHSAELSCYSSYGTGEHLTFFPSVTRCFPLYHAIPSNCSKSYFILFIIFFFLLLLEQKLKCFLAQTDEQSPEVTKSHAQEAMEIQGFEPTHFDSDLHEVNVHLFAELWSSWAVDSFQY